MMVFELIKHVIINILNMIMSTSAGKTLNFIGILRVFNFSVKMPSFCQVSTGWRETWRFISIILDLYIYIYIYILDN